MIRTETVEIKQLQSLFDRWARLEEEKSALSDALKELFVEAKSRGLNPKALRAAFRYVVKSADPAEKEKLDATMSDFALYVFSLTGTEDAIAQARDAREAPALKPETPKPAPLRVVEPAPAPKPVMADIPPFLDRRGQTA